MIINPYIFTAPGGVGTPFVTGQTLGTRRNNGGDYSVGFRLLVGGSGITVVALGRWKDTGDSATHTMGLYDNSFTPITSVSVDMSQTADADGYVYASITPQVLSASTYYRVMTLETSGVDHFYDFNTSVTTTAVAIASPCYRSLDGGSNGDLGANGESYGPVNFKYT